MKTTLAELGLGAMAVAMLLSAGYFVGRAIGPPMGEPVVVTAFAGTMSMFIFALLVLLTVGVCRFIGELILGLIKD